MCVHVSNLVPPQGQSAIKTAERDQEMAVQNLLLDKVPWQNAKCCFGLFWTLLGCLTRCCKMPLMLRCFEKHYWNISCDMFPVHKTVLIPVGTATLRRKCATCCGNCSTNWMTPILARWPCLFLGWNHWPHGCPMCTRKGWFENWLPAHDPNSCKRASFPFKL